MKTPPSAAWIAGTAGTLLLLSGGAFAAFLVHLPPTQVQMSAFATRLDGRTPAQKHNAELAARCLDGVVIAPHGAFSFNKTVRGWSSDRGYVRAPVSFDGELVPAFGGGVCQTSTTLYNAALLAGLTCRERHHHVFAPQYVAPGRDAAVAYPSLDLGLQNPYPFPIRLRATATGNQLRVEVWGKQFPCADYTLTSRILNQELPGTVVRAAPTLAALGPVRVGVRHPAARSVGATGFRVVTYRVVSLGGGASGSVRRERLSDDSYPSMPAVVRRRMMAVP